jgi:signal transduction histidine kinase
VLITNDVDLIGSDCSGVGRLGADALGRRTDYELRGRNAARVACTRSYAVRPELVSLVDVLDGLQEISRGIHPAILSKGGLGPAFKALSRRSAVPVELYVRADRRLPAYVEVAAYYVASEALTNAAKHASASVVTIGLDVEDAMLRLEISDDGVGGADSSRGSGLVGLADRIEALGGRFELTSPMGQGTALLISVPVPVETQSSTALHAP